MAELCRFDELRIKTDRQLIHVATEALARGIREARQALRPTDARASAEGHQGQAKRAYAEAARLIPLIAEIPEDELNRLEGQLAYLRDMLDGLLVLDDPGPAEDSIPTLARALWKARDCPEGSPEEDWFRAEQVLQSLPACVGR